MLLLSGMRLLSGAWVIGIDILFWYLGCVLGFLFVFCDRLVDVMVARPRETMSMKINQLFGEGKLVKGLVSLLGEREKQNKLMMRSVLFLAIWIVLAFWTVSSVSVLFARGFVLGLGTHLVFDFIWDYIKDETAFENWFWQIKRTVSAKEKQIVVLASCGVFIWLVWWL